MIVILLIIVFVIALFHSALISRAFKRDIKPTWLLFVIYPIAVLIAYLIEDTAAAVLTIILFGSTFVVLIFLFLFGIILSIGKKIKDIIDGRDKEPIWRKIASGVAILIFIFLFFSIGPFSFILLFAYSALYSGGKDRFFQLETALPTSKIRSMAMGLVEVEGQLEVIEQLKAPIANKRCIGYQYFVDEIGRDKKGKTTYYTIQSEEKCNRFFITDDTGRVEVNPDKLEMLSLEIDEQYTRGDKRYTQFLLKPGEKMLLIGKATLENNRPIVAYEAIKEVFAITASRNVNNWNKYRPLRRVLTLYVCLLAFFIAIILIVPIKIEDGQVIVHFGKDLFSW